MNTLKTLGALFGRAAVALVLGCTAATTAFADIAQKDFDKAMDSYLSSDANVEKLANSMQAFFMKKQQEARKQQEQQSEKEMAEQFKNPVKIDVGNSPVRGPASAKVTIIEFSDFQCPFCKKGKETMDELMKMYPNDVKLVFKNLPLPMHPQALPAAKAALAAHKQGKFWEMHDALFANQGQLGEEFFTKTAQQLGLDIEKFKKDMASPEVEQQIKTDSQLAGSLNINGTPGFFVNGVAVRGAYPVSHFKTIIDRWLAGGAAAK